MALGNDVFSGVSVREETPLLRENRGGHIAGIPETSARSNGEDGDEENSIDLDKANQHVGKTRGAFIILSLWGLIFLQGRSTQTQAMTMSEHGWKSKWWRRLTL